MPWCGVAGARETQRKDRRNDSNNFVDVMKNAISMRVDAKVLERLQILTMDVQAMFTAAMYLSSYPLRIL